MKHNIKIIGIDGQPWGMAIITEICKTPSDLYHRIKENTYPFPGATIGDVIEGDKVEVVWQYKNKDSGEWITIENPDELDSGFVTALGNYRACHYEIRNAYLIKQQPVSESKKEVKKKKVKSYILNYGNDKLEPEPVSKEPEEIASSFVNKMSKQQPIDPEIAKIVDANYFEMLSNEEPEETVNISKLTNSEIGSYHWFATLIGQIKRVGEFLKSENELPPRDVLKSWGENSFRNCNEIIEWWQKQQEGNDNRKKNNKNQQSNRIYK